MNAELQSKYLEEQNIVLCALITKQPNLDKKLRGIRDNEDQMVWSDVGSEKDFL